jgi:hypothetical protein
VSDDDSIFAWQDHKDLSGGVLARSPNAFQLSSNVVGRKLHDQPPYWMTNKGLRMERQIFQPQFNAIDSNDTFILPLQCASRQASSISSGILLKRIKVGQFARISSSELLPLPLPNENQKLLPEPTGITYITNFDYYGFPGLYPLKAYKFVFPTMPLLSKRFAVATKYASGINEWEDIGGNRKVQQLIIYNCGEGTGALEFIRFSGDSLMPTPLKLLERVVFIFDVYYNRSRMAVYIPNNLSLDRIMDDLIEPGDWMTKKTYLFGSLKLKNRERINRELVTNGREWRANLELYTYQANVSAPDSATNWSSFKQQQ